MRTAQEVIRLVLEREGYNPFLYHSTQQTPFMCNAVNRLFRADRICDEEVRRAHTAIEKRMQAIAEMVGWPPRDLPGAMCSLFVCCDHTPTEEAQALACWFVYQDMAWGGENG